MGQKSAKKSARTAATTTSSSGRQSSNKRELNTKEFITFCDLDFTKSQLELQEKINKNEILFVKGPAGSSKTFTTLYQALKLLKEGEFNKIVLTKPLEANEDIGYLKGSLEEKMAPYVISFFDNIEKMIGKASLDMLIKNNDIDVRSLAFLRGTTLDHAILILDEAQNCDFRQLLLYITRMGKGSKVIVLSDVMQHDIKLDRVGVSSFMEMVKGIKGVATHEFTKTDVVRNKILIEITDRYEKWLAEGKVTKSK